MACDIPSLVADGAVANAADKFDSEAAKVYLLALALKAQGGADYTDICALAESMNHYHGYSDYQIGGAELVAIGQLAQALGVRTSPTAAEFAEATRCSHCCSITSNSMKLAEIQLWCLLAEAIEQE